MERFVILDGSGFAHRALHARGGPKPARRFFETVLRTVGRLDPSYLAIALDGPREDLVRRAMYDGYKAQRPPVDLEVRVLFQKLWQTCRELGMATVGCKGWEADDVIGTLAQWSSDEVEAIMVSADKDLAQLVRPGVRLYDIATSSFVGEDDIRQKFGVRPDQIAAYLAIVGDRVDGIPGLPGMGPKAAQKLLKRYDSLEGIQSEGVWDGGSASVAGSRYDDLALWADLTRIRTDLDLRVSASDLEFNGLDLKNARNSLAHFKVTGLVRSFGLQSPYP